MREHAEIHAILPQRYPLLLVDRVLAVEPGRSIRTVKAISGAEACYAGLPDGAEPWQFAYPRSLLIESLGQSAALLWLDGRRPVPGDDRVLMFVGARDYRFEGSAYPGDLVQHEVRLDSVVADTAFASGQTWVGDRRIATVATLIAARRAVPRPAPAVDLVSLERTVMTPNEPQLEELRELVAEVLELEPEEVSDTGDFVEDYQADSLRAIEILARIDKQFKVEIPQAELPELRNLQAVHAALSRHASGQG